MGPFIILMHVQIRDIIGDIKDVCKRMIEIDNSDFSSRLCRPRFHVIYIKEEDEMIGIYSERPLKDLEEAINIPPEIIDILIRYKNKDIINQIKNFIKQDRVTIEKIENEGFIAIKYGTFEFSATKADDLLYESKSVPFKLSATKANDLLS